MTTIISTNILVAFLQKCCYHDGMATTNDPQKPESSTDVLNTKAMIWVGIGFVLLLILWAAVLEPMMTRYNPFRSGG
jgi:hypothetical protein